MDKKKCRICLEEKAEELLNSVISNWNNISDKTIKDILLFCVPTLTIHDATYICQTCLWQLKFTYHFIDRCLKTEKILVKETKDIIQKLTINGHHETKLENIIGKSIEKGNKIQIIFENPSEELSIEPEENDVILAENDHTYSVFCENQTLQEAPEEINSVSQKNLIPNIKVDDSGDNDSQNDNNDENASDNNDDWFNQAFAEVDKEENKVKKKRTQTKKRKESDPEPPKPPEEVDQPYPQELVEMFDFATVNVRCITVRNDITPEQQQEMVKDGINILNMSTNSSRKKRVIYLSRDVEMLYMSCNKCKKSFDNSIEYADHRFWHQKGKMPPGSIFKCGRCTSEFTTDVELREHFKAQHGLSRPHECSKCHRRFKTYSEFKRHTNQFKNWDHCMFKCPRCNREFSTKGLLKNHEAAVADAPSCNYKTCKVCSKKFTKEGFREHCKEHPNYLCQQCGKSFHSSTSLSKHEKNVHDDETGICDLCGKVIKNKSILKRHMDLIHSDRKYMCDKCPRVFKCTLYLKKHQKTHLTNRPKSFVCNYCEKAFHSKTTMAQHVKVVHVGNPKFVCPICSEGFRRGDYLKRHLIYHDKYVENTCTVCKRSFASETRLETHLFYGHDENGQPRERGLRIKQAFKKYANKPCICYICNKVLGSEVNLKKHYRSHLKIRTIKCEICDMTMQSEQTWQKHMKRHEDPNFNLRCNICHIQKSSLLELEEHKREVHKNPKYACRHCPERFGRKHLLFSHESIKHQEENAKKEDAYKLLTGQKPQVVPQEKWAGSNRKGIKLGSFTENVDQVLRQLNKKIQKSMSDINQDVGQVRVEVLKQNNSLFDLDIEEKFNILGKEYQMTEDEKACKSLQEDFDFS